MTRTPPSRTTASPGWSWSPPCSGCSASGDWPAAWTRQAITHHHLRRVQAGRPHTGGRPPLGAQRHHLRVLRRLGTELRLRCRLARRASRWTPAEPASGNRSPASTSGSWTTTEPGFPTDATATSASAAAWSATATSGATTAQALRCFDGWYTVGDQGYLADGTLHMLGRRSDMIITAGNNVYPHEVELALASVPGVASAVAAGMADDLRGQRVVAGVVPSHGGITATQLKAGCDGRAARGTSARCSTSPLAELPADGPRESQPAAAARLGRRQRSEDPPPWLSSSRCRFRSSWCPRRMGRCRRTGSRWSSPPAGRRIRAPTGP